MENIKSIKKYDIFSGLEESEISALLRCFSARSMTIPKNTIFIHRGEKISYFYIITQGIAKNNMFDENGNPSSTFEFKETDIIGLDIYKSGKKTFPFDVLAKTDMKILLVDAFRFINPCQNFCARHTKVLINAMGALSRQNASLLSRLTSISKTKTKDKILAYLNEQRINFKSNEFDIPYTHQELANFLGVERSALSKELSLLQKDGIITYHQKHYIIH